jgi:hypothetical protein
MIFANPLRDFFHRAVVHAKKNRMSELNLLEAELIMMEEKLLEITSNNFNLTGIKDLEARIDNLKKIIRALKKSL